MKKRIIVLLSLMLFLTACSSGKGSDKEKDNSNDIVVDETVNIGQDDVKKVDGFEVQERIEVVPIEHSYYFNVYDSRYMQEIELIKDGIRNLNQEITLNMSLSPEEAKHIMTVIWLDEPEFYYLDQEAGFEHDKAGNVIKIFPKYTTLDTELIEEINGRLERMYSFESKFDETAPNYDVFLEVYERLSTRMGFCRGKAGDDELLVGRSADNISTAALARKCFSPVGRSKMNTFVLRRNGIEALTVYGEFTSDLYNSLSDFPDFETAKEDYKKEDNRSVFKLDTKNMYAWNMVKANHDYYHMDTYYNSFTSEFLIGDRFGNINDFHPLTLVNDFTASQSRLSYFNEDFLGVIPMADNNNFTYYFRKGMYQPKISTERLDKDMDVFIKKAMNDKYYKYDIIQFEDVENFNYFVDNFDRIFTMHNEKMVKKLEGYDLTVLADSLTIYLTDVK